MLYDNGNYLAHHGVKGQKWGIRRYQDYNGELTPEGKARYANDRNGIFSGIKSILSTTRKKNPDAVKKTVLPEKKREDGANEKKKKDPSEMTDEELREGINRMRAESEYNRLYSELNRKPENKFKKTMEQIFVSTATTALASVVQEQYKKKFTDFANKGKQKTKKEIMRDEIEDLQMQVQKKNLEKQLKKSKESINVNNASDLAKRFKDIDVVSISDFEDDVNMLEKLSKRKTFLKNIGL